MVFWLLGFLPYFGEKMKNNMIFCASTRSIYFFHEKYLERKICVFFFHEKHRLASHRGTNLLSREAHWKGKENGFFSFTRITYSLLVEVQICFREKHNLLLGKEKKITKNCAFTRSTYLFLDGSTRGSTNLLP